MCGDKLTPICSFCFPLGMPSSSEIFALITDTWRQRGRERERERERERCEVIKVGSAVLFAAVNYGYTQHHVFK